MRKLARVPIPDAGARWVLLHETSGGVYVFPMATDEDGSSVGEDWFESLDDAIADCAEAYAIHPEDWASLPDPAPGCQQDWVDPVRRVEGSAADGRWTNYERFVDGDWTPVPPLGGRTSIEEAARRAGARLGTTA